ncbi:uncharacterized protein UHOD_12177 [Ustilago sp. UG-2017b]|nr:uncharacterized protein UHOD_12177 [Ustilago sp. UG-2017b]
MTDFAETGFRRPLSYISGSRRATSDTNPVAGGLRPLLRAQPDLVPHPAVFPGSFAQSAAASLATPAFARLLGCLSHAATLFLHGLSECSRHQYNLVSEEYQAFCLQHFGPNRPALPSSDLHLIEWVAELGHSGRSYHTVRHRLAALSSWHVDLGLDSSAFSHPHSQQALKGFKQLYGVTQCGQKLPITLPILQGLLDALRVSPVLSSSDRITFTAAFTLAYACLLRCAKFTWSHLGDSVLRVGSIMWSETYATLRLARSKTDPFGKGVDLIVPKVDGLTCPYTALLTICGSCPLQAPLFALDDRAAPFSCNRVIGVLQQLLGQMGIPASAYASHSFRQGGATWATCCGASTKAIQALGRWSSDCFHRLRLPSPSAKPDLAVQPVCPRMIGGLGASRAYEHTHAHPAILVSFMLSFAPVMA